MKHYNGLSNTEEALTYIHVCKYDSYILHFVKEIKGVYFYSEICAFDTSIFVRRRPHLR